MLEIFKTRDPLKPVMEELSEFETGSWIHLTSPTESEIRQAIKYLDVPEEFIRDPLDEEEQPRLDFDDDSNSTLIVVDLPYIDVEDGIASFVTMPLGILYNSRGILTISIRDVAMLDKFKLGHDRSFVTQYHTRFCLHVLHAGAREYLRLLRYMDKTIDGVESQLSKSISNRELFKLMQLGKSLIYFTTSLKSDQAVIQRMMRSRLIKKYDEDEDLLEDVMIEYNQALEMANIYASIINGTMDAYASIISNNLNVVMKFMAAITILLTVPTLITSFFGQNIPLPLQEGFSDNPGPFIIVTAICLLSVIFTLIYLKRKDMF